MFLYFQPLYFSHLCLTYFSQKLPAHRARVTAFPHFAYPAYGQTSLRYAHLLHLPLPTPIQHSVNAEWPFG